MERPASFFCPSLPSINRSHFSTNTLLPSQLQPPLSLSPLRHCPTPQAPTPELLEEVYPQQPGWIWKAWLWVEKNKYAYLHKLKMCSPQTIHILQEFVVVLSLSHVWLCDHMDSSSPRSSVHRILQTKILEWVAISFSRGWSQPRDQTGVSYIAGGLFTAELQGKSTIMYVFYVFVPTTVFCSCKFFIYFTILLNNACCFSAPRSESISCSAVSDSLQPHGL